MKRERKLEKEVKDAFGNTICVEPNLHSVTWQEKTAVKRLLKMPYGGAFPKCKFRNWYAAAKLDKELGFTKQQIDDNQGFHTKNDHVCSECRCKHVAGHRTKGWWYWSEDNPDGLGEIGHYGVGPCYKHGPYGRHRGFAGVGLARYNSMIMKEIEAMQQHGQAPEPIKNFLVQVVDGGRDAEMRNDLRDALESVKAHGEKMVQGLESPEGLTEKCGKGVIQMTDATAYDLKLKYLKACADIAKTEFDASQNEYAHKDEIRLMVNRFLSLVEAVYRPKGDNDDWEEFSNGLKDCLTGIRMGKK